MNGFLATHVGVVPNGAFSRVFGSLSRPLDRAAPELDHVTIGAAPMLIGQYAPLNAVRGAGA